jgi:hypothetical protein|tara:strand:+ start:971 stop:1900 length:930 start_codon:yes stop_codon:yes gene_type:complete
MTNIAIITDPDVGGNFLRWTILRLAGYHNSENPVTQTNAHGHNNNTNISSEKHWRRWLSSIVPRKLNVAYMHNFHDHDINESTKDYHLLTAQYCKELQDMSNKTVLVSGVGDQKLYHCSKQRRSFRSKFTKSTETYTDIDEQHNDYMQTFFGNSLKQFNNTVWDYREFLALNHNPWGYISIRQYVDTNNKCYILDQFELYRNFDVQKLFNFLELELVQERLESWQEIYQKWIVVHGNRIKFATDYRTIVLNILKNIDYDLISYNLDIMQEAAILYCLIHDYNLNLKNWQLERFENCSQLHNLLEQNMHK